MAESVLSQVPMFSENRVRALGHFAELGGSIDFYGGWVPGHDPNDAATRIMAVAGYLAATQIPLEASREIAIRDTKEHFETQTDPDGVPWPELDEDYRHYKVDVQGYPEDILVRTGMMMDAATSHDAWIIVGEVLVFDPFVLPKDEGFTYGVVHQQGGSNFDVLEKAGEKYAKDVTVGLPPRPFIGLSDEAMADITAEMESWFSGLDYAFNNVGEFPIVGSLSSGQPIVTTPAGPRFARKA